MMRDLTALTAFINSRQNVGHAIGRKANDCAGFALDAVEAQTGTRAAPRLNWSTPAAALKIIRRFGSLEGAFDAFFERVPPAFAVRGDIAGVPDEEFGIHPMIVEGMTLVCPGEEGNKRAPRSMMTCAWSAVRQKA
jgi:hypothetical protein